MTHNKFFVNQKVLFRTTTTFFTGRVMATYRSLDGTRKCVVEQDDCGTVMTMITMEDNLEPLSWGRTTDKITLSSDPPG